MLEKTLYSNGKNIFKDNTFSAEEWSAPTMVLPEEIRKQIASFKLEGRKIKMLRMIGIDYYQTRDAIENDAYKYLAHYEDEERQRRSECRNIDPEIPYGCCSEIDEPFLIGFEDGDVFEIVTPQEPEFRMSMNCIPWDIEAGTNKPNADAKVLYASCIGKTIINVEVRTYLTDKDPMFHDFLDEERHKHELVSEIILWLDDGNGLSIKGAFDYCDIAYINKNGILNTIPFGELKKGLSNWEDLHKEYNMNFAETIKQPEYQFLHDSSKIQGTLCYLTVSGSYAYGTNNENSDLDIRGIAIEDRDALLLGNGMEQYEDRATDTVVYGLQKYVSICRNCNPNALEMLGTRPEHVLYMNAVGQLLRDNIELFISKKAYQTFAGYATSQLRRIQNAMAHDSYPEEEKERHIKKSIDNMMLFVKDEYDIHEGTFDFDIADGEDGPRLVVSVGVEKMPLRKFIDVNSHLYTLLRNYDKLNHRNRKKDEAHLRKHAMHLVRLYLTGIDILRGNGVHTYREKDLPLLRDIRAGKITMERVFKLAEGFEAEIKEAYLQSKLPAAPDQKAIDNLLLRIYREQNWK